MRFSFEIQMDFMLKNIFFRTACSKEYFER